MLDALLGSYYISIIYNHSSDVLLTFLSFPMRWKQELTENENKNKMRMNIEQLLKIRLIA